ncbi:NADH-ubiquinone oxidoreductase subunit F [Klebsiella pneumoniae]|uniref:NADH-ubiquinone oxidoreductase subunit F n=1 Tax=Klebsiella pneumoniae TaxID=573 RepID=A0A377XUN0_KLEPN|nr:NADH-ubiquinone oxidoreductase subunit F [Klebsiella pneumoniae]
MEFESIGKAGSRLGTSLAMAVDHEINMVSLVRNLEEFFARESCGWCTPCRDGLPWSVKILRALERGEGQPGDIETLEQLCRFLGPGKTFCAHAPGAVEPLQSAINISAKNSRLALSSSSAIPMQSTGFSRTCLRRAGNLKVFLFLEARKWLRFM